MRCRLFMMLANVAQNPFCYNMKKSPHAMYSDIPIGMSQFEAKSGLHILGID